MKNLNEDIIDEKAVSIIIGMMPASHHTTLPKPCFKKKHQRYWSRQAIFDWQATHCNRNRTGVDGFSGGIIYIIINMLYQNHSQLKIYSTLHLNK